MRAGMSLRQRLLLAIAAALFASFIAGAWVTAWQAGRLVRAELVAALDTGRHSVADTLQDLATPPPPDALLRLVSSFDGSRHVRAELLSGTTAISASQPAPVLLAAPSWFVRLASPKLAPLSVPVAGGFTLRLTPLPLSEVGERWGETRRLVALLGLFSTLSAVLCVATVSISLRPLAILAGAFRSIEHGHDARLIDVEGPPEIASLGASFNRMQKALQMAGAENRRLSAQLARLAEEERAELARDLHDEIGPLLFAITAWAAAARMQQDARNPEAANASIEALENAAAELQKAVRDLLRRLRDSAPTTTDLAASLSELVDFWRTIRPQIIFDLATEEAALKAPENTRAALFRVAQEAISNAVRHGDPSNVSVRVGCERNGIALRVEDDGVIGADTDSANGFGLAGMEERLHAVGGTLEICRDPGWKLVAWAPAAPEAFV